MSTLVCPVCGTATRHPMAERSLCPACNAGLLVKPADAWVTPPPPSRFAKLGFILSIISLLCALAITGHPEPIPYALYVLLGGLGVAFGIAGLIDAKVRKKSTGRAEWAIAIPPF